MVFCKHFCLGVAAVLEDGWGVFGFLNGSVECLEAWLAIPEDGTEAILIDTGGIVRLVVTLGDDEMWQASGNSLCKCAGDAMMNDVGAVW